MPDCQQQKEQDKCKCEKSKFDKAVDAVSEALSEFSETLSRNDPIKKLYSHFYDRLTLANKTELKMPTLKQENGVRVMRTDLKDMERGLLQKNSATSQTGATSPSAPKGEPKGAQCTIKK